MTSAVVRARSAVYLYKTTQGAFKSPLPNVMTNVSLTSAVGSRTLVIPLQETGSPATWERVCVGVSLTWAAATDVQVQCYGSLDGGLTYYTMQNSNISAGLDTLADYVVKKVTGGADVAFQFTLEADNNSHIKLIFNGTGAAAGDTITVQVAGGSK